MLPTGKPREGQMLWMLPLAAGWMLLGSACGSKFSSSDLHLLSPTSGAPLPSALSHPDRPQGLHGPRHHQPSMPIYRSPTGLRAGHGESPQQLLDVLSVFPPLSMHHHDGWSESEPCVATSPFLSITRSLPSFCPSVFLLISFSPYPPSFNCR